MLERGVDVTFKDFEMAATRAGIQTRRFPGRETGRLERSSDRYISGVITSLKYDMSVLRC